MESSVFKNKTVLIVDDYKINAELLSIIVEETGANIMIASNGEQCVEIVKQKHIDIILMDKNMPVMNGLVACRKIRCLQQGEDIIIVGITGSDDSEDAEACIKAGMNMVCGKLTLNIQKLYEIGNRFFGNGEKESLTNANRSIQNPAPTERAGDNFVVMDFDKALYEFENDRDLLYSLMKEFSRLCNSKLILMRKALEISDYTFIQNESHGIKGGAANLCAFPLSNAANSLEKACKQNANEDALQKLLDDLAYQLNSFEAFVLKTCT